MLVKKAKKNIMKDVQTTQTKMPFILKIKETEQYRLFGSLPILCRSIGFDEKQEKGLSYVFSQKKENKFEDDKFFILKRELERGGSQK